MIVSFNPGLTDLSKALKMSTKTEGIQYGSHGTIWRKNIQKMSFKNSEQ